jgi:hypothetical protein
LMKAWCPIERQDLLLLRAFREQRIDQWIHGMGLNAAGPGRAILDYGGHA